MRTTTIAAYTTTMNLTQHEYGPIIGYMEPQAESRTPPRGTHL